MHHSILMCTIRSAFMHIYFVSHNVCYQIFLDYEVSLITSHVLIFEATKFCSFRASNNRLPCKMVFKYKILVGLNDEKNYYAFHEF